MSDNFFFENIYSKYTKGNNEAQKRRILRQQDNCNFCKWKSEKIFLWKFNDKTLQKGVKKEIH